MKRCAVFRILLCLACTGIFPALLCGQSSYSSSTSPTMQVSTSAQNPVLGSAPEAKPTPGVLRLTFSGAIERALRQNLAGLLSEYNTIEARGEKWQKLSDLLPNVNGDVQEARMKTSLEAEGLTSLSRGRDSASRYRAFLLL